MPQLGEDCIWCEEATKNNSDLSHVLPECFGNPGEQVLPKGTVCLSCNSYFGSKIEPALIEDPVIHAICVALRVIDPGDANVFRDRLFDDQHVPIAPPQRSIDLNLMVRNDGLELDVSYEIKGTLRREYERQWVARFSRAIHKVAFESFVWIQLQPDPKPKKMDLFSETFRPLRKWARYGEPNGRVRPLLRMAAAEMTNQWETKLMQFEEHFALELRLFGDWLVVSLTSSQADAQDHLKNWYGAAPGPVWLIGDSFGGCA